MRVHPHALTLIVAQIGGKPAFLVMAVAPLNFVTAAIAYVYAFGRYHGPSVISRAESGCAAVLRTSRG